MNWHWIVVTAILLYTPASGLAQQIDWQTDLDTAKTLAASQNKMVLMHFSADWCRPCKHLETFVFTSPKVVNSIDERVVAVRIDTDLNPDLVKQYNVSEIPTDVVITPTGRIVQKRQSPKDSSNYVHMMCSLDSVGKALSEDNAALAQKIDNILDTGKSRPLVSPESNDFVPDSQAHHHPGPAHASTQLKDNMSSHAKLVDHETSVDPDGIQPETDGHGETVLAREPERVINDRFFNEKSNAADASSASFKAMDLEVRSKESSGANAALQPLSATAAASDDNDFRSDSDSMFPSSAASKSLENQAETAARESTAKILPPDLQAAENQPLSLEHGVETEMMEKEFVDAADSRECSETCKTDGSCSDSTKDAEMCQKNAVHFALGGKCPVTLITEGKWQDGDVRFGCMHRGKTYLFVDQAKLTQFQQDPESFSPLLAGFDPVLFHEKGELVEGLEKHGVFMGKAPNQRIVLFQSTQTRSQFQQNPRQYMATIRQAIQQSDTLR